MLENSEIFQFEDYTSWLDFVVSQKLAKNRRFSKTAFAKKLGLSQSFLSLILRKKRKLSSKRALHIASVLKLSSLETHYLRLLIEKTAGSKRQAKAVQRDLEEIKKRFYTAQRSTQKERPFSAWHYSLLLAATDLSSIDHTISGLAKYLGFSIDTVRNCLELLNQLGLVKKVNEEYWAVEGVWNLVPEQIVEHSSWKICKTILEQAHERFDSNFADTETIWGRVTATNPKQIVMAKKRIAEFMKELDGILSQGDKTTLIQYSLQLFDAHWNSDP